MYVGAAPKWLLQVTGILNVLIPFACTVSIIAWVVTGFPQPVSVPLPSKVLPRFQPRNMFLTYCPLDKLRIGSFATVAAMRL